MKVLGIDPGIERLGWAVLEKNGNNIIKIDSGVKKTLKTKKESARLFEIYQFIENLMQKYDFQELGVEKVFFAQNVKTALVIGEVRGLILALGEKYGLTIKEFTPLEVKSAICGYGKATKDAVAQMVKIALNLKPEKLLDDETDAIAIALTAIVYRRFP